MTSIIARSAVHSFSRRTQQPFCRIVSSPQRRGRFSFPNQPLAARAISTVGANNPTNRTPTFTPYPEKVPHPRDRFPQIENEPINVNDLRGNETGGRLSEGQGYEGKRGRDQKGRQQEPLQAAPSMLELALMTSAILMGWSFGKMFYEASQANRPSLILTEAAIEPKTSENVTNVTGASKKLASSVMEYGTEFVQNFDPVIQICSHLCGVHFYSHDMTRQVEAHHYCTKLNDDFWQCLIYDSPDKNARLIGIEYIISERLFTALPEEEQKYWHSHTHEVKGGVLVMPVVPYVPEAVRSTVDHIQMKQIVNTYGKTWHTWQVDRGDKLPFGPPQLMMAFTVEGQVDPKLIESRDKRFNLNTKDIIRARRDIHADHPTPDPRADHWQHAYEYQKAKELVGGSAKVVTNTGVPKGAVGIEEEPKVLQVDMRKVAFHSSHDRPEVARF